MVDYHCHILPGIDDGAETIKDSIAMARLLSQAGYSAVHCTPHLIKDFYEADNDTVRRLIGEVQEALDREKIRLKLLFGREYMIDDSFYEIMNNLVPLENTRFVLVEFLPDVYQGMIRDSIATIIRKGFTPMIAHPERYHLFQGKKKAEPAPKKKSFLEKFLTRQKSEPVPSMQPGSSGGDELLAWLDSMNCAFQNNLPSFQNTYGEAVNLAAQRLKERGIYTHTGTDAHSPQCLEKLFGLSSPTPETKSMME